MYPGERGIDFSLYWHQPSIIAWQICRCVGDRLAEHWEGWSSRGHGIHSLVRSVKHWKPAFWVGNWAAWVLPHVVQSVMLSLDKKQKFLVHCTFHSRSLWHAFQILRFTWTFLSMGAFCMNCQFYRLPLQLAETQLNMWFQPGGDPGLFVTTEFVIWAEKQAISLRACLQGSCWGTGTPCSQKFPHEMQLMRKEHIPRKMAVAEGPLAPLWKEKWVRTLDWSDDLWEVEGGKSFPDEDGGGECYERKREKSTPLGLIMQCPCAVIGITSVFLLFKWEPWLCKC